MKYLFVLLFLAIASAASAQAPNAWAATNGQISFFSETPVENIHATNSEVGSVLEPATGKIVFRAVMKKFMFENATMQEHFNDNYMESARFPNAEFDGVIVNHQNIDFTKRAIVSVTVKGKLTIHGVTREVEMPAKLDISADRIRAYTSFNVRLEDYNIRVPDMVVTKIAEVIRVDINVVYKRPGAR